MLDRGLGVFPETAVKEGIGGNLKYPGDIFDLFKRGSAVAALQASIVKLRDAKQFGSLLLGNAHIAASLPDVAGEYLVSFGHMGHLVLLIIIQKYLNRIFNIPYILNCIRKVDKINRKDIKYLKQILEGLKMAKNFSIEGNICGERVRLGRALHKPPLTQEELAMKIQFMGMGMTKLMISRIEQNQRHVCDAELLALSKALGVSMEWLCGEQMDMPV